MRTARIVLALVLAGPLCACGPTEVVFALLTDFPGQQLNLVRAAVRRDGQDTTVRDWQVGYSPTAPNRLPGSYSLYASDGSAHLTEVVFTGYSAGRAVVERRVVLPVSAGESAFYRIGLVRSCAAAAACPAQQTCVEGECRPFLVDPADLAPYHPGDEQVVDCYSGAAYYDTGTLQALSVRGDGSCPSGRACVEGSCRIGGAASALALVPAPSIHTGSFANGLAVADFDGNHVDDLAVSAAGSRSGLDPGSVALFLGDGGGRFRIGARVELGIGLPTGMATTDLDQDGHTDVVVALDGLGYAAWTPLWGTGDGNFDGHPIPQESAGRLPLAVVSGAFDGSGVSALALANSGSDDVEVIAAQGSRFDFSLVGPFPVGGLPTSLAVADLDGDALPDVAVADRLGRDVSILSGRADGGFGAAVAVSCGPCEPVSVVAADLDGDGHTDLAVADYGGDAIIVEHGDGRGHYSAVKWHVAARPIALVAADLDGDGLIDLAAAHEVGGVVSVLRNAGARVFERPREFPAGAGSAAIAKGDFDGDGRPDLAIANSGDDTVTLLFNHAR